MHRCRTKLSDPDNRTTKIILGCTLRLFTVSFSDRISAASFCSESCNIVRNASCDSYAGNLELSIGTTALSDGESMRPLYHLDELGCEISTDEDGNIIRLGLPAQDADKAILLLPPNDTLKEIWFGGTDITDNGLEHLSKFPALEEIYFFENRITDKGLASLSTLVCLRTLIIGRGGNEINDGTKFIYALPLLQKLKISETPLKDRSLKGLSRLDRLQQLDLYGTDSSDVLSQELARLGNLEILDIPRTCITDRTVKTVAELRELESLDISWTNVTRACLDDLTRLPQLKYLYLAKLPGDGSLESLAGMKTLSFLSLRECSLGTDDIEVICNLKQLKCLDLENCIAPPDSLSRLKKDLPDACAHLSANELRTSTKNST